MINQYKFSNFLAVGIPSIEVEGNSFECVDLYEIVGRDQFCTTFYFNKETEEYKRYGLHITGFIFYDHKLKEQLELNLMNQTHSELDKVKIDTTDKELTISEKHDLKYRGVNSSSIAAISYFPYKNETSLHESGEKRIPNRIEIKTELSGINPNTLLQNYLMSKLRHGTKLITYEKEQLIGLTLGHNNLKIDNTLLEKLSFNLEDINDNHNIWFYLYKALDFYGRLDASQKTAFAETKFIRLLTKITAATEELLRINNKVSADDKYSSQLFLVFLESLEKFEPSVLMHGKQQVYWDIDSYIHIALRHVKDYQFNAFKNRTSFLYKVEDLSSLIEGVIYRVEDDLRVYLSNPPTSQFVRNGKMGVEFNGDHYNLRIEADGRLTQFHMVS